MYNYLVFNKSLRSIVKKECFDLALMWAITGLFFRGHFRSLNKSLRLIVKKECFDLALMWAITGLFFRGHFRSLITRA